MSSRIFLILIYFTSVANPAFAAEQLFDSDSAIIFRKVDSLTANLKTDFDKIKAIYSWITQNIRYDNGMYQKYVSRSNEYRAKTIFATYESKKGVCFDYAQLFKSMVNHIGIKCEVITGYGRHEDIDFFREPYFLRHAWNAVFIKNEWLLLDVTWETIVKSFPGYSGNYFFLQSADKFIYTHFPDDVKWTLLQKPIGFEEFVSQPMVKAKYFEVQTQHPPKHGIISTESENLWLGAYFCNLVDSLDAFAELVNVADNELMNVDIYSMADPNGKRALRVVLPFKGKFYLRFTFPVESSDGIENDLEFITFLIERK